MLNCRWIIDDFRDRSHSSTRTEAKAAPAHHANGRPISRNSRPTLSEPTTGRVFTREQLLDSVIGDRAVVIERNIDVHVRAIRKKLGTRRNLVVTIRGVGYRFRDQEQSA